MELRQLEYFVGVAEERHFTRAAEQLMVSQSGLSASIRTLEEELGASLFSRSTRRVELTDVGRAFLPEARQTLARAAAARNTVAVIQGLLRGELTVGTIQCLTGADVPGLLAEFHQEHPHVDLRLQQASSTDLVDDLRSGTIDVAFVSLGACNTKDLQVRVLAEEPMVLACALDHPKAEHPDIDLEQLDGESFIDFTGTWGSREEADRMLAEAGVHRQVALQVNDAHLLLDLVSRGLGVAVVPQHFKKKTDRARFVPLTDAKPWRTAIVTTEPDRTSATARAFLDLTREKTGIPANTV